MNDAGDLRIPTLVNRFCISYYTSYENLLHVHDRRLRNMTKAYGLDTYTDDIGETGAP